MQSRRIPIVLICYGVQSYLFRHLLRRMPIVQGSCPSPFQWTATLAPVGFRTVRGREG